MYNKQQASQLRQQFWTLFGQYMRPVKSADGETVNWVNYHTGIKHIYFRMDADNKTTSIGIELHHPDKEMRLHYFEQLYQLKKIFEEATGEEWEWKKEEIDEHGRIISTIRKSFQNVNVVNENDWPTIISFLKPRMIALDQFWSAAKYRLD